MRSLIEPVVVEGFGFIIIDDCGAVLFHSDPKHTLTENFFIETDNNRRLRALVAARRTEWLDLKYWGDDHRAFVSPLTRRPKSLDPKSWENEQRTFVSSAAQEPSPATLVTLYDKDVERAVHVEWLVLVTVFLLMYAGMYVGTCVAVLIVRPGYRAPWLWPDPAGSRKYLDLLPALLLLLAAFVVATATLPLVYLLFTAWLLPLLSWVITYFVLNCRLRGRQWQAVAWPALFAAALLAPLLYLMAQAEHPMSAAVLVLLLAGATIQALVAVQRRERGGRAALAPPPNVSYGLAATVLLVLVAVLPVVASFKVAYDMQIETLVKHGQLQSSKDRRDRTLEAQRELSAQVPDAVTNRRVGELRDRAPDWGIYDSFFFSTRRAAVKNAGCENVTTEQYALPELMEELLPFYSEGAVRFRELAHNTTADGAWQWSRDGGDLVFCSPELKVAELRSALTGLFDGSTSSPAVMLRVVWLVLGSLIVLAAAIWIVRFVIYNIFVADVIGPLWTGSGDLRPEVWGPNLFLVSTAAVADPIRSTDYCVVDLKQAPANARTWFAEQTARIQRAPASQSVLVLHFDERLENAAFTASKLHLLEKIIKVLNRTVVVVSAVPPSTAMEKEIESTPRWAELMSLFTIVPVKPALAAEGMPGMPGPGPLMADWATAGWREVLWHMNALGFAHAAKFLDSEREDPQVRRLWEQVLPYAWHPERPPLEVGQLLVEVGERAESHYQEIWASCTPAEQLALGHVAEEGLVNRKTKPTIRRLMARGLVRRQPNFVLMNETFRRFVLAMAPSVELAALEESSGDAWATVRMPFLVVLMAGLVFLFFTQQELFSSTLGVIAGVGTAVPTLMKMASMFGQQRSS